MVCNYYFDKFDNNNGEEGFKFLMSPLATL